MKKILLVELEKEEIEFIKNKPVNPCSKCLMGAYESCCGCDKLTAYNRKIKVVCQEVLDMAIKYDQIKDIEYRISKLEKEKENIIKELPKELFE